jgi:flagellar hook-basal body complex protein FliE
MLTPMDGIQPISGIFPSDEKQTKSVSSTNLFATTFQSAIENVQQTDVEKNQAEYLLATGQLDNPAELTIASTKAQLSVELLVQLRTKALESYNELMRINL